MSQSIISAPIKNKRSPMYPHDEIQAVFFDLDGTLLDTATDLGIATNQVLVYNGFPAHPLSVIQPYVGGGISAILKYAVKLNPKQSKFNLLKQQILQAYQQRMHEEVGLFPGMKAVLEFLVTYNIPWGIVTNKPMWLAEPLIKRLQTLSSLNLLIGREDVTQGKPHPMSLQYACQQLFQVSPLHVAYVGDSHTDILAANTAGLQSIAVTYGYIPPQENPAHWQASHLIHAPEDLITWLRPRISNAT